MRIYLTFLLLSVTYCTFSQTVAGSQTKQPSTADTSRIAVLFSDYQKQEKQQVQQQQHDSIELARNLKMLDQLLQKREISSEKDIAKLRAIDTARREIILIMDTAMFSDSLPKYRVLIGGSAADVYDLLSAKKKSGLANPSHNVEVEVERVNFVQVEILPRRSNSLSVDTAAYMNRIKSLVKANEARLRTEGITVAAYRDLEKNSGLHTATDYLNFRASFIRFLYEHYQIYQR